MSQQQQQIPVTVEEALKLFSEVQQLTVRDAQDSERFTAADSKTSNNQQQQKSSTNQQQRKASASGNNTPRGGGGGSSSGRIAVGSEAELRRQLELSEAVMKKLHTKNKALTQELDELKGGSGSGGNINNTKNSSSSEVAALKKKVAEQDTFIRQLQQQSNQNSNNSNSSSSSKPPLAQSSVNNSNNNSISDNNNANLPTDVKLLQKRVIQLQQQYESLVDVKLECIRDGESTGKVNKEVKSFFVSSRQKMLDDASFHEAERSLLNERLAKLESEVLMLRTNKTV